MSTSQFLGLDIGSGFAQVKAFTNATATNIGVPFGTGDNNGAVGTVNNTAFRGGCIVLDGTETFLAVTSGQIWRSTNAGASWTSVYTLTGFIGGNVQSFHTGLRVSTVGGTQVVCIVWSDTATYHAAYSTDGGVTWTATATVPENNGPYVMGDVVMWNGSVYWSAFDPNNGQAVTAIFNPGAPAAPTTVYGTSVSSGNNGCGIAPRLCVFNNNLYMLYTAGGAVLVDKFTGSSWNAQLSYSSFVGQGSGTWELFVQGGAMHALFQNGATWHGITFNSTVTNVTNDTVITAFSGQNGCAHYMVDSAQGFGSEPQGYIFFATDRQPTTPLGCFLWTGNPATISLMSSGSNTTTSLSIQKWSGGPGFWQSGLDRVDIFSRVGVTGGIRYSFKLYSTTGTDVVSVRGYFGGQNDAYTFTPATLANPSSGSLSGAGAGNSITGLVADNTTTYQVTWSTSSDGLPPGSAYSFMLELV